jgi:hypothetical protein
LAQFDTSDYDAANKYGIPRVNKKVIGLMKDENAGKIMMEFVGLRAKMYSYKVEGKQDEKKAKGVTSSSLRKIKFDDYFKCLFDRQEFTGIQNLIRSKKHQISSIKQKKLLLSPFDNKRNINYASTDTTPWGYNA